MGYTPPSQQESLININGHLEEISITLDKLCSLKLVELRILANQKNTGVRWEDVEGWLEK